MYCGKWEIILRLWGLFRLNSLELSDIYRKCLAHLPLKLTKEVTERKL